MVSWSGQREEADITHFLFPPLPLHPVRPDPGLHVEPQVLLQKRGQLSGHQCTMLSPKLTLHLNHLPNSQCSVSTTELSFLQLSASYCFDLDFAHRGAQRANVPMSLSAAGFLGQVRTRTLPPHPGLLGGLTDRVTPAR